MLSVYFITMNKVLIVLFILFISVLGNQDIDQLINKLDSTDAHERAYAWEEMALYYWGNDPVRADSCFRQAISEARQLDSIKVLGDVAFSFGRFLYYKGKLDTAAVYLSESLAIRKSISDSVGIGKCLSHLGLIYWLSNDHLQARQYLEEALEVQHASGEKEEEGKILTNLGNLYRQWGDYKEALNYYIEALEVYREIEYTEGIAWLKFSLGMLYKNLDEYLKALNYFNESLAHYQVLAGESEDTGGIRICYSQIGEVNLLLENLDEALAFFMKAYEMQKRSGVDISVADGLRRIAQVYYKMGRCEQAYDYASRSLAIRKNLADRSGLTDNLIVLGRIHDCLNQAETALSVFREGLLSAREQGNKPAEARILKSIAEIFEKTGQVDSAYHHLKCYETVRDSVFNDRVSSRIASLQVQYELKEQEQKNQRLQQDIRIQELQVARQKLVRNYFMLLSLVGLIILLGTIILYRIKARDHRKIVKTRDALSREIEERKAVEKEREQLINQQQDALEKIKTLSGLIPICSHCHKIRNDKGYYEHLEKYIMDHSDAVFSHGICPECLERHYPDFSNKKKNKE
ncbi:MAG: tetratricopeptide repeat protein [Calditrichaeota bacterium]|nr:MAG: tetratricopeptide repeat protein [Calditrichota bacterium]